MKLYLVDTNVMLAASAVIELSGVASRAMPQEIELREQVFDWLKSFDLSDNRILLDEERLVRSEYERNMPFHYPEQEYGMQVLQNKLDRGLVEFVPIATFEGNGEHIAVLSGAHETLVSDREDRKWVACSLSAQEYLEENPPIVYGAETDWYMAENDLRNIGIQFIRLLPDAWYEGRTADL